MGDVPKIRPSLSLMKENHHSFLSTVIGDEQVAKHSRIYSYGKSFNAIAARLLPHEAKKFSEMEGVVSVFESGHRKLHTTRSWDFMGFPSMVKRNGGGEGKVIVGMLDTGIWPSSRSFKDEGLSPPPKTWKGKCMKTGNFSGCNRKIIGARYYRLESTLPSADDELSPVDMKGHGTHTSSIVAGVPVSGASLFGIGDGMARGGVPMARISMYKVCWMNEGCSDMDILAGFDDAIADRVHIISISIGGYNLGFFNDPIAIGAFHAMRKGILTTASAGNEGPQLQTIANIAPWILTVAASGTDRQFRTKIRLGNGKTIPGISINTFSPKMRVYPLISGANAANKSSKVFYGSASSCDYDTLDKNVVNGKVVYCIEGMGGQDESVKLARGAGAIIRSDLYEDTAFSLVLPAAFVTSAKANIISNYINTTKNPQAVIYKSREVHPDIAAPGVDILAAYSRLASVTGSEDDERFVDFNVLSGTSMACPHATATAAYVKSFHPDWSPAAIKSAILTTAKAMDPKRNEGAEFAYGSGHIHPARAVHPGLVYDADEASYMTFLCKEGYNETTVQIVLGTKLKCSKVQTPHGYDSLNYPTMQYRVPRPDARVSAAFRRVVTNIGGKKATYKVTITAEQGLNVTVKPETLKFRKLHQRKSFRVVLNGAPLGDVVFKSAQIVWGDGKHWVRSPIVVYQTPI
ncbi:hypothetical protein ACLOJK_031295 [Asimina triloba]